MMLYINQIKYIAWWNKSRIMILWIHSKSWHRLTQETYHYELTQNHDITDSLKTWYYGFTQETWNGLT